MSRPVADCDGKLAIDCDGKLVVHQSVSVFVVFESIFNCCDQEGRVVDDNARINGTSFVSTGNVHGLEYDVTDLWNLSGDNIFTATDDVGGDHALADYHIRWCCGELCCNSDVFTGVAPTSSYAGLEFYSQTIVGAPPTGCFDPP